MPEWSKLDERNLACFVNSWESSRWLTIPVNRMDLQFEKDGRRKLIQAIYETLISKEINYSEELYNPDALVQTIRSPEEILNSPKVGTCLDLALLFSGLCIANELLPIMLIIEGHALMMVSLQHGLRNWNDFSRGECNLFENDVVKDVAEIRSLIAGGEYLAIECTGFAKSKSIDPNFPEGVGRTEKEDEGYLSFERAVAAGREQLNLASREFLFAIDIATAQFAWKVEPVDFQTNQARLLNPFKLLNPFTTADTEKFFGRGHEINNVIDSVEKHTVTIVHGKSGIGKTSMLAAGVTDKLIEEGFKVLQTNDYLSFFENGNGLSKSTSFTEAKNDVSSNKQIWILDQFEQLFELFSDDSGRNSFFQSLIELQKKTKIKLIFSTQEYDKTYEILKPHFNPNEVNDVEIGLLSEDNSRTVIINSLQNNGINTTNSTYITNLLLPELNKLSAESEEFIENEGIYPPILQIVCFSLFDNCVKYCNSTIGEQLFNDHYNSCEKIVKDFIKEQLGTKFSNEISLDQAIQVLGSIISSKLEKWFYPKDLLLSGETESIPIEEILDKLVSLDFLFKRPLNDGNQYALAGQAVNLMIAIIADEKLKYQKLAIIELKSVWKAWTVDKFLADPKQVKTLSNYLRVIEPDQLELLLLLRSAVEHKLPPKPLLDAFMEDQSAKHFIIGLEESPSSLIGTVLSNTSALLNIPIEQTETQQSLKLDSISQTAITNNSPQVRQTSALLLTINDKVKFEDSLLNAFNKIDSQILRNNITGLKKSSLLTELRGIIYEAYPDVDEKYKGQGLGWLTRLRIYFWLIKRQIERNSSLIINTSLLSGLFFGVAFGIFEAIIGALFERGESPGVWFFVRIPLAVLGSAFAFGLMSSACLLKVTRNMPLYKIFTSPIMSWKECAFISLCGSFFLFLTQLTYTFILRFNNAPRDNSFKTFFFEVILLWALTSLGGGLGYLCFYKLQSIFGKFCWIIGGYFAAFSFGLVHYFLVIFYESSLLQVFQPENYYNLNFLKLRGFWSGSDQGWTIYFSTAEAAIYGLILFLSVCLSISLSAKNIENKMEVKI